MAKFGFPKGKAPQVRKSKTVTAAKVSPTGKVKVSKVR